MKRMIIGVVAVLLAGLAVFWGIRVYQVNRKYPKDIIHWIAYGDPQFLAEDISMQIQDLQWISFAEAKDRYVEEEMSEDGYYCLVEVLLENVGTKEAGPDLTQLNLETSGYSNAIALDVYLYAESTTHPVLQPGEKRTVLLAYTIYDFQWKPGDWKQIREQDFWLGRYDYPDKWCWEMQ